MEFKEVNIYSHDDFNNIINYYNQKNYSISFLNDDEVIVEKKIYGDYKTHLLLFIFTVCFSFGVLNLLYLFYSYIYYSHSFKIIYHPNDEDDISYFKHSIVESKNIEDFLNSDKKLKISKKVKASGKYPSVIIDFLESDE